MPDLSLYWAEEALGEPYAPQDYRWMKSTRRAGLLLGATTCVLTAGALLGGAAYYLVDSSPHVVISSYEVEVVTPEIRQALPAPAASPSKEPTAPAARGESPVEARSAKEAAPRAATIRSPGVALHPVAAGAESKVTPARAEAKARPSTVVVAKEIARPTKSPEEVKPKNTLTPAPTKTNQAAVVTTQDVPAAKPEPDTRMGISKSAESKPTDIASGEKLGIREILPDGIVMHNGRKVKNGSALPNGEVLMGTDAGKGMAETDRRVLVLTP